MAMFHMANDSGLFRQQGELASAGWKLDGNRFVRGSEVMLPLYEAKMAYIFNHRSGTYEGTLPDKRPHRLPNPSDAQLADPRFSPIPYYWVDGKAVAERLNSVWERDWLLGWRDVTDARASVRTVVAAIIPRSGVGDTFLLAMPSLDVRFVICFYANLSSILLDYATRQKVGGLHLKYNVFRQIPTLSPGVYSKPVSWDLVQEARDWLLPRTLELGYTAWDLKPFAEDCGEYGPPFIWDPVRRFQLQCELDAAFFHLYGISRDDAAYILDTFNVLQRAEMKAHGEYRTKRVILEIYDALAEATRTGRSYRTRLEPPPADPRVAHPHRTESKQ